MNQKDSAATPMYGAFTSKPNYTPFTAVHNQTSLTAGLSPSRRAAADVPAGRRPRRSRCDAAATASRPPGGAVACAVGRLAKQPALDRRPAVPDYANPELLGLLLGLAVADGGSLEILGTPVGRTLAVPTVSRASSTAPVSTPR